MVCGMSEDEVKQLDREIVKRAMKWRAEAEARERANRLPPFQPLAELEAKVK